MKISEIPLFLFILFTLIYAVIGDPNNENWSGAYFLVNYLTMFILFKDQKSKLNRVMGMALSVSILIFIVLKYIFKFECERYYTLVTFLITLVWIYRREKK